MVAEEDVKLELHLIPGHDLSPDTDSCFCAEALCYRIKKSQLLCTRRGHSLVGGKI